jgi:hypothetical protein
VPDVRAGGPGRGGVLMKREYVNAMMGSRVHTWATPPEFFAALHAEFDFTLDPCCVPETAKCARYYTPADDGLAQDWSGERVFMNPPYGRALRDYAMRGEVRFVRGRIAFLLDGKPGAPAFDSAIVIFRPAVHEEAA